MSNFEIAFECLRDLYGMPNWKKEGQSIEKIKMLWEEELDGYSGGQIKEACYRLFRYRKTMTFPTISQLMAMLYDEEKPTKIEEYVSQKSYCPELELYNLVNPSCSFGRFVCAFQMMTNEFKGLYPQFSEYTFNNGLVNVMQKNGWWGNKILEYIYF